MGRQATGEGCSGRLRFSMAMLKRVALGLPPDLKDRPLYLLLVLSAVSLFVCFQLGLRSLSPWLVNVGEEGDQAYVTDFHQRESNEWSSFRWTQAASHVRLADAGYVPATVTVTLNGWRPEGQSAPEVVLLGNGRELARFVADKEVRSYEFRYLPAPPSLEKDLVLEIRSETFSPPSDQAGRTLGVLLDSVQATPIAMFLWPSSLLRAVLPSLAIGLCYLTLRSEQASPWRALSLALAALALACFVVAACPLQTFAFSPWAFGFVCLCYTSVLITRARGVTVRGVFGAHTWLVPLCIALVIQTIPMASVSVLEYDEAIFLDVARNAQRTGLPLRSLGDFWDHTPLYIYFLSLVGPLVGGNPFALRFGTMLCGLGSVVLTFHVVRRLRGALAATIAASLVALNPFFATYSFFLRMEVPMCFFLVLAVHLLLRSGENGGRRYLPAAGLSVGAAVLLKEVALAFWAASVLYVFLSARGWRQRLSGILWMSAPTILGLALWFGFSMAAAPELFRGMLRVFWQPALHGGVGLLGAREGIAPLDWLRTVGGEVIGWGGVLLFVAGVACYLSNRKMQPRITRLLLLYVLTALGASLVITLKEPRHVIGLIPTTALVTGLAIDWPRFSAWLRQRRGRLAAACMATLVLAWDVSPLRFPPPTDYRNLESWWDPTFAYRVFESHRYYGALREAGRYLGAHTPPAARITVVHEGPVVAYYADRLYVTLYGMSYDEAIETLGRTDFLVLDQVLFVHQSEEQIQQVLMYVEEHFEVEQVIEDAYRQVVIYRRRGPVPADVTSSAGDHGRPLSPDDRHLNCRPLLTPQSAPLACKARQPMVALVAPHLVSSARVSL